MPDGRVGADPDPHLPGEGDGGVRPVKAELSFLRFDGLVLHIVFRREAAEVLHDQAAMLRDLLRRHGGADLKILLISLCQGEKPAHDP